MVDSDAFDIKIKEYINLVYIPTVQEIERVMLTLGELA